MTATTPTARRSVRARPVPGGSRHVTLATFALAMGGFAIGTTEFVTMGLLEEMARGVGVSIPAAGHVISTYALGVVVGAPLIAIFGARLPRKGLLLTLMSVFVAGNAVSALAVGYGMLTLARFLSGVPHGAYFGVASLVAASLVAPGRRGRAVSMVMLGLPIANMVGVPRRHLDGTTARLALGVLDGEPGSACSPWCSSPRSCPRSEPHPQATGRRELRAFSRVQVWLTLLVGAVGFGGMFAMYSYIAPTVTDVTELPASLVPLFLLAFGIGGTVGTLARRPARGLVDPALAGHRLLGMGPPWRCSR